MTQEQELLPPLFPPQSRAVAKAINLQRCPIIGTMGSGKTRVALEAWGAGEHEQAIVLCGTNAIPTWYNQAKQWCGISLDDIGIAHGTAPQRAKVWRHSSQYQLVITTPNSFLRDIDNNHIPIDWSGFIDEYHKTMRTRTQTWNAVRKYFSHSRRVFPVTGTPMRRGPQDMWPILSVCQPKRFTSYWDFINVWCFVEQTDFGMEILGPKNLENFKEEIYGQYTALMPKKETDKYLPKKVRIFVPIQASKKQRKMIEEVEKDSFLQRTDGRLLLTPNQMTKILRERQILCTPKLLDPEFEYGAGLEALWEHIENSDCPRPVVFTDFGDAVPIFAEFLQQKIGNWRQVWTLRGGEDPKELHQKVDAFNKSKDDIMVVSLQYAQSFEFPRSQVAFVLGFNWSKDENEQAEDRLRRAISEYQNIKIYYFQYENTVDGHMLNTVRDKAHNVRLVTPEEAL